MFQIDKCSCCTKFVPIFGPSQIHHSSCLDILKLTMSCDKGACTLFVSTIVETGYCVFKYTDSCWQETWYITLEFMYLFI